MRIASIPLRLTFVTTLFYFINDYVKPPGSGRGDQYIYSFEAESIGYSDIQSLYSTDTTKARLSFFNRPSLQAVRVNIHCNIKMTTIEENIHAKLVCYEITRPEVLMESNGIPVNSAILNEEMTHPVFVHLAENGLVTMLQTDKGISDMATNLLKEIISHMQFVIPNKHVNTWQTTEENTTGTYRAIYRMMKKENDSGVYEKSILAYTKLKSPQKGEKVDADSKVNFSTNAAGTVKHISVSEAQVILFNKDTISAIGSKIVAELGTLSKVSDKELVVLDKLGESGNYTVRSGLSSPFSEEQITRLAYAGTLGNDNWETLMQRLRKLETHDSAKEDSLVLKFRALAWLFPANCLKMGSVLKNEPYETPAFRVLSRALIFTETNNAVDEIAAIIEKRQKEEKIMIELLPALATTKSPTQKALHIVKQLAFGKGNSKVIATTAQLALGGLANNLHKIDAIKSDELTRFLIKSMDKKQDTLQQILVLGNIGSVAVLPLFQSYINSKEVSQELRLRAISGLRLIKSEEVAEILNKLLINKQDSLVVNEAKKVISFRKEYFENEKDRH